MKKLLLILSLAAGLGFGQGVTAQEVFEADGIYYEVMNQEMDTVIIVRPDNSFTYTGDITIVPEVTYNNHTYKVYPIMDALSSSTIENLTIGEGFRPPKPIPTYPNYCIDLRDDRHLKTITFKSFEKPNDGYIDSYILVPNTPDCIYLFMRQEGDKSYILLYKFNVYGPDGEKLKPFLHMPGRPFDDTTANIYPDENGIFTLDKNWSYNGKYGVVLPTENFYTVAVYVAYEGKYGAIGCFPDPLQPGIYTEDDGVRYWFLRMRQLSLLPPAESRP